MYMSLFGYRYLTGNFHDLWAWMRKNEDDRETQVQEHQHHLQSKLKRTSKGWHPRPIQGGIGLWDQGVTPCHDLGEVLYSCSPPWDPKEPSIWSPTWKAHGSMGPPEINRCDKGKPKVELHSMTGGDSSQPTLDGPTLHRGIGRSPGGAPLGRLAPH